ncbi:SusD/RagB family nutrient-binding outer membrane lipoprotein [Muricauda sp. ANG21]|uniref:SusD/RagB family nutrient-binding outer membrane lipoprotein n=1 Tax=Allomuricauda sp. ANG21 TaxID=3042468 RepID=UPI0034520D9E
MKTFNKIFKTIFFFTIATLCSISCTEDYENFNTDPTLLSEDQLDVGLLLTRVQKELFIDDWATPLSVFGNYAGYSSSAGNQPFSAGFFSDEFGGSYANLINISEIIRLTKDDPEQVNKHAIAKILRVYIYQRLTDIYGDVPYSEAVQSVENVIVQPKYDTQESIYLDMLNELQLAAASLDENAEAGFGGADLVYGGDVDKWKKFANSLKLRLALRVIYSNQSLAADQINGLLTSDLMGSNDDNAFVTTSEDLEGNRNPIYNQIISNGEILAQLMGKTIIDLLQEVDDPRLTIFALPTPNSIADAEANNDPSLLIYRGRPLGLEGSEEREHYVLNDLSQIGDFFRTPVLDLPVLNYSEVCFALAEAKLVLGLGNEDADIWYKRGITANMELYGIGADAISAFLSTPVGTLSGSTEEQLEQILSQKNIALFPNAIEGWTEWRRTGFPRILIGSMIGETGGTIPRRINYPVEEGNINSANYQEVSERIGGDFLTTKVWWDTNTNVPYEHPGDILD